MKQVILLSIIVSFLSCIINDKEVLAFESMNTSITPRVMMGVNAEIRDFKYVASLRLQLNYFCIATCVGEADMIAPASCFTHIEGVMWPYFDISIHIGTTSPVERGQVYRIKRVTVHTGWTGIGSKNHNIAHIKIDGKIEFNEVTDKISLPTTNFGGSNVRVFVTGWGRRLQSGPTLWEDLKFTEMWTLTHVECEKFVPFPLNKEQLCTYQEDGYGCTEYDRGAPIVDGIHVIGIHSFFSRDECFNGQPEVYTNIYSERFFLVPLIRAND